MGCVYELNFPNGKKYYGMTTKTAQERFLKHVEASRYKDGARGRHLVHKAINKYGKDSIEVNTLFESEDIEMLCLVEIEIIENAFRDKFPIYNIATGGLGVKDFTGEVAKKIGKKAKERFSSNPKYREQSRENLLKLFDLENGGKSRSDFAKERWQKEEYKIQFSGENHHNSKITNEIASKIKEKLASRQERKSISEELSVALSIVNDIAAEKVWNHIPWPNSVKPELKKRKLYGADVLEIKKLISDGFPFDEIAIEFCVDISNISHINKGKIWKEIPWPLED